MNRDELMKEKEDVDYRMGILKAQVERAKRDAARRGKFLSPAELQAKETKLIELKRRSQEIQRLLANTKDRKVTLPARFMHVAEEYLPPAEFERLLQIALSRNED